jgi:hypothetical protein
MRWTQGKDMLDRLQHVERHGVGELISYMENGRCHSLLRSECNIGTRGSGQPRAKHRAECQGLA